MRETETSQASLLSLFAEVRKVLHGDQVVELSGQLEVHEREEKGEDGEGQIEVEEERGELKEKRSCITHRDSSNHRCDAQA